MTFYQSYSGPLEICGQPKQDTKNVFLEWRPTFLYFIYSWFYCTPSLIQYGFWSWFIMTWSLLTRFGGQQNISLSHKRGMGSNRYDCFTRVGRGQPSSDLVWQGWEGISVVANKKIVFTYTNISKPMYLSTSNKYSFLPLYWISFWEQAVL